MISGDVGFPKAERGAFRWGVAQTSHVCLYAAFLQLSDEHILEMAR